MYQRFNLNFLRWHKIPLKATSFKTHWPLNIPLKTRPITIGISCCTTTINTYVEIYQRWHTIKSHCYCGCCWRVTFFFFLDRQPHHSRTIVNNLDRFSHFNSAACVEGWGWYHKEKTIHHLQCIRDKIRFIFCYWSAKAQKVICFFFYSLSMASG